MQEGLEDLESQDVLYQDHANGEEGDRDPGGRPSVVLFKDQDDYQKGEVNEAYAALLLEGKYEYEQEQHLRHVVVNKDLKVNLKGVVFIAQRVVVHLIQLFLPLLLVPKLKLMRKFIFNYLEFNY